MNVSLLQRRDAPRAGVSFARGQPWLSDVQVSASEARMERRYGPKRAGAWLRRVAEKALAKAERAKARSENLSLKLRRPKVAALWEAQSCESDPPSADYTIRGVCGANNLFLLSRASSDAYEPYMILKDLGEESLTPSFSSTIPLSRPKSPCPCPCRRPCP